ncbi:MAG: hypothetical protein RLZZ611_2653 [Cyanobacteriota bacterium]|jgi:type IV pilus assembly protein PilB
MTLSSSRPVPPAATADQRRLEIELLHGEALLTDAELEAAAARDRWSWIPLLSHERCSELGCLPVQLDAEGPVVAVPADWTAQQRQELLDLGDASGLRIRLRRALEEDITRHLKAETPRRAAAQAAPPPPAPPPAPPLPAALAEPWLPPSMPIDAPPAPRDTDWSPWGESGSSEPVEQPAADPGLRRSLSTGASSVVHLVDTMISRGLERGSSDIHIEPQQDGLLIRHRQDGVLEQLETLPQELIPAFTSRLKIMADLDIAERRLPQDGRIRHHYEGREFDLRVSTLPTRYGEKVCIRILDNNATHLGLDKLITDSHALATVREMGSQPFGMLLVTGPTGSGKSTTLYSLLAERNSTEINISTVEDPIEYSLKGITQTQVNRDKGYDFSLALRAFMRQDPDVLLVGETRDQETAKTAIEAALTGHLVLTTLHCNDAPSAIGRLTEMGMEPFMLSASLLGIVSQRLVRRVCLDCRVAYQPSEMELGRFGLLANRERSVTFFRARRNHGRGVCPTCHGLGYKGRIGVYEVLRVNEAIATAIAQGTSTAGIRKLAMARGMKTLLGYSLELVRQGYTTLEEVERMILTDSGVESERRLKALRTISCRGCGAGLRDDWLDCPYCLTARGVD